jgi:hypothetical protein
MSTQKLRISELVVGDYVDLEGDEFADPKHDHPYFESEYEVVECIEKESKNCICVHFENSNPVGFPPDHLVSVSAHSPDCNDTIPPSYAVRRAL